MFDPHDPAIEEMMNERADRQARAAGTHQQLCPGAETYVPSGEYSRATLEVCADYDREAERRAAVLRAFHENLRDAFTIRLPSLDTDTDTDTAIHSFADRVSAGLLPIGMARLLDDFT